MLVLTRKQNEKIRIGSSIVITVVRMKGKAVRLGIEAPSDVNILRGELAFETTPNESKTKDAVNQSDAENPAQEGPRREKTAQPKRRNPTGHWSGQQREERSGSSWPTALTEAAR